MKIGCKSSIFLITSFGWMMINFSEKWNDKEDNRMRYKKSNEILRLCALCARHGYNKSVGEKCRLDMI